MRKIVEDDYQQTRSFLKPFKCFIIIFDDAYSVFINYSKITLAACSPLHCRFFKPFPRFVIILFCYFADPICIS